ncbi:MAG: glutamate racemase [Burkholderiaceae bacterium]|jgi:glutamate racemase|nr:glutamate racemase [Burkholderiaceae bacterium]
MVNAPSMPVGIFDSGIGGLSVLRHIRAQLPVESLCYFADSGFAPYGEKPAELVIDRTLSIARYLLSLPCKALVVACNTATAEAIHILRAHYPATPIVGIEPGLKPATQVTKNGIIGVMATERTLMSHKFQRLYEQLRQETGMTFIMQACPGLADRVEHNDLYSARTEQLVLGYVRPLMAQDADTIVLGCTHYPFLEDCIKKSIRQCTDREVQLVDTGVAVTRQLVRVLQRENLTAAEKAVFADTRAFTTGNAHTLAEQFEQLLHIQANVSAVPIETTPNIV